MRSLIALGVAAALAVVLPAGADARSPGEFVFSCTYSHTNNDDPIVFPGKPNATHSHDFAGGRLTNAFSTVSSLLKDPTSCAETTDHAGYWIPTLYQNGFAVHPREFRVYYRGTGSDAAAIKPFPVGLRIVAGDAKTTDAGPYQSTEVASWACTLNGSGSRNNEVEVQHVPSGCRGEPLRAKLRFPQCWNGRDLDSPDHKSHMAYAARSRCPTTHPVQVPQLTLGVRFWIADTKRLSLSSGGTHSLHADFLNAWTAGAQESLVRRCINGGRSCS